MEKKDRWDSALRDKQSVIHTTAYHLSVVADRNEIFYAGTLFSTRSQLPQKIFDRVHGATKHGNNRQNAPPTSIQQIWEFTDCK